jgi:hypothetical protein
MEDRQKLQGLQLRPLGVLKRVSRFELVMERFWRSAADLWIRIAARAGQRLRHMVYAPISPVAGPKWAAVSECSAAW